MKKNKTNWKEQLSINLRGGVWLGLFTFVMLMKLTLVCFAHSSDFTSGSLTVYGTIVSTYGLTRLGAKFINGKNGNTVGEE